MVDLQGGPGGPPTLRLGPANYMTFLFWPQKTHIEAPSSRGLEEKETSRTSVASLSQILCLCPGLGYGQLHNMAMAGCRLAGGYLPGYGAVQAPEQQPLRRHRSTPHQGARSAVAVGGLASGFGWCSTADANFFSIASPNTIIISGNGNKVPCAVRGVGRVVGRTPFFSAVRTGHEIQGNGNKVPCAVRDTIEVEPDRPIMSADGEGV